MMRVVVMAESPRLTDAIVSNLSHEAGLRVFQVIQPAPAGSLRAIRQECPVLIIIEEGKSKSTFDTANDFLRDCRCFRMITLSPHLYHCHTNDRYEMPVAGPAQVIDLPTAVRRES